MSYILSAGTLQLPDDFDQQQLDFNLGVTEVDDIIVFGQITDCETGEPIVGAIVKYFVTVDGELVDVCHTFTGCDGYYMFRVPSEYEGEEITIMAVGSDCPEPLEPCECP